TKSSPSRAALAPTLAAKKSCSPSSPMPITSRFSTAIHRRCLDRRRTSPWLNHAVACSTESPSRRRMTDTIASDTAETCSECGAPRVDGLTCWEQLGALLAREGDDAELRAEHFLTVAAYNLQHPAQFTEAALAGLRSAFVERLDHGVAVEELRRRA